MASNLKFILLSASVFFFGLGVLFAIIAYLTPWLVPKRTQESTINGCPGEIVSIGLITACFSSQPFCFDGERDPSGEKFTDCKRNTKDSASFTNLRDENLWSPQWFQTIQDMVLSCVIILVLSLLMVVGYLVMYFYESRVRTKKGRMVPCLMMCKAGLALWFIIPFVMGIILFTAPMMFYANYEDNRNYFYAPHSQTLTYGSGFGLAIGSAFSLWIGAILSCISFVMMCKNYLTMSLDSNRDNYYSDEVSRDSREMDRLPPDGNSSYADVHRQYDSEDDIKEDVITNYNSEPARKSVYGDEQPDYQMRKSTSGGFTPDGRPIPVPRPRSSVGTPAPSSREPSVSRTDQHSRGNGSSYPPSRADNSSYQDDQRSTADSARPSTRGSTRPNFLYDYQPGRGYVPKSATQHEPQLSARSSTLSPTSATGPYYHAPGQRSPAASDTESQRGERNHSTVRSSLGRQVPEEPPKPTKIIEPKQSEQPKASRYATGW